MNLNEWLSELFLLVIVIMSALVAWEFYKSKNGQLRVLIISLFITKIWVYGGALVYYCLTDVGYMQHLNPLTLRLVLNFPMAVVMFKLWQYIRTHNR